MNWILLAILTAFLYGAYNFFIKVSSSHINQIVGAVILQVVAALVGSVILIILKLTNAPLEISSKGVGYAIVAGVMVLRRKKRIYRHWESEDQSYAGTI